MRKAKIVDTIGPSTEDYDNQIGRASCRERV